jgi:hypothetical protein
MGTIHNIRVTSCSDWVASPCTINTVWFCFPRSIYHNTTETPCKVPFKIKRVLWCHFKGEFMVLWRVVLRRGSILKIIGQNLWNWPSILMWSARGARPRPFSHVEPNTQITQFLIHLNLTLKLYPFICIDTTHFTCIVLVYLAKDSSSR